jgi:hypothetical protein
MHTGNESVPLGVGFLLILVLGYDLEDEPAGSIFINGVSCRFGVGGLPRRHDFVEFF